MNLATLLTAVGVAVVVGGVLAGFLNKRTALVIQSLKDLLSARDIQISDMEKQAKAQNLRIDALESNVWGEVGAKIVSAITKHDETILNHLDIHLQRRDNELVDTLVRRLKEDA